MATPPIPIPDPSAAIAGSHSVVDTLLSAVLSNGPTSMVALLLLDIVIVLAACNYVIKLVLAMGKDQVSNLLKQIEAKERELAEMNRKSQDMMTKFLKLQEDNIDVNRGIEIFLTELRARLSMLQTARPPASRTRADRN